MPAPLATPETLDPDYVNDYVEAFEAFCRTATDPIAEKVSYQFDNIRPPYLLPRVIAVAAARDPIESIKVKVGRHEGINHSLSVAFAQESGDLLVAKRTATAAQNGNSFSLHTAHANPNREPTFIDTVNPLAMGRFLTGLAIGRDNRLVLALDEHGKGSANAYNDPQSVAHFDLIMHGLEHMADRIHTVRRYRFEQPREEDALTIHVGTTLDTDGPTEYELEIEQSDIDGENRRNFAMSVAIAHTYGHQTDCQADIAGGAHTVGKLETVTWPTSNDTLSVFGLTALYSVTQAEIAVESLRSFWQ